MNRIALFWRSTVGKKFVMAITGLIGIVFVIGHLAGNLLVYRGAAAINAYGHFLKGLGELLWLARIVLIGAVVLHVWAAWSLTRQSHAARPEKYAVKTSQKATIASRLMRWGGVYLLVFIVLHILHFTTGQFHPEGQFMEGDIYSNVVRSFQIPWLVAFYVIGMVFLGLHLYHGAWASVRTLGVTGDPQHPTRRRIAAAVAALVWLGFTLIPVGVMLGWVG